MKSLHTALLSFVIYSLACCPAWSQNPIIRNQFTADPTARVFGGRMYLYPSHDIAAPAGARQDWFCMADYHVFSSDNLIDWTDHGVILSQENVPWGKPDGYSMWAPDCVEKDGKYYFYFPDAVREGRGFAIGVAVSDSPTGPFIPEPQSIKGITGIDPCVLIDDDGQSYIYWSSMGIRGAKLKSNMKEVDGALNPLVSPRGDTLLVAGTVMEGLPDGFKEGPFAFKRNGWYYLTFPWVRGKGEGSTECLAYAMSRQPLGPWEFKGVFMEEHKNGCWTNHHSFVEYRGQWYLFYHRNDLSPDMDKRRSARIERFTFNADGTIPLIYPTAHGVVTADSVDQTIKQRPHYFSRVTTATATPDSNGYLRRWRLCEPVAKEIRSNTVFTDSYLRSLFSDELAKVKWKGKKWHNLDSETYNVRLFRFGEEYANHTYGSLFWAETVIECTEDISDVRLSAGSNGASMWWIDGREVLLLSGDRRMVEDDGRSLQLSLAKGKHTLRCALVNGPGLSDFCVRFVDSKGTPVTNYLIKLP